MVIKIAVDGQVRFGLDAFQLHVMEDFELELDEVVVIELSSSSVRLQAPRHFSNPLRFHPSNQPVLRGHDPQKVASRNNTQTPSINTIFHEKGYSPRRRLGSTKAAGWGARQGIGVGICACKRP